MAEPHWFYQLKEIHWLASFPKSGSTWLRMLFHAHQHDGYVNINSNERTTFSDSLRWAYMFHPLPIERISLDIFPYLRVPALINMFVSRSGAPFVMKTHCANVNIHETRLIPMDMTKSAVYLIRDPRDVVVSYANHFKSDIDRTIEMISNIAFTLGIKPEDRESEVPQYPTTWSLNVKSWTESKLWSKYKIEEPLVIRYEDLLTDTVGIFKKVLDRWGVEHRDPEGAVEACRISKLREQEKKNGFIEGKEGSTFFNRGESGAWKDVLTKAQEAEIIKHHSEMMEKWGYI